VKLGCVAIISCCLFMAEWMFKFMSHMWQQYRFTTMESLLLAHVFSEQGGSTLEWLLKRDDANFTFGLQFLSTRLLARTAIRQPDFPKQFQLVVHFFVAHPVLRVSYK